MKIDALFSKSRIIFLAAGTLFLIFVAYHLSDVREIGRLARQINPWWLAAALAAEASTYFCTAFLYRSLAKIVRPRRALPLTEWAKLSVVIIFANHAIPSSGVSGNGFLFHVLSRKGFERIRIFSLIIMELLTSYTASILAIGAAIGAYAFFNPKPSRILILTGIGCALYYAALFAVASALSRERSLAYVTKKMSEKKWLQKYISLFNPDALDIAELIEDVKNPWTTLFRHKPALAAVLAGHMGVFLFDALAAYALLRGFGVNASFLVAFVAIVMATAIGAIPVSPTSLVLFEGSMAFLYTAMGVPVSAAIVVTLLDRAISFWAPMPIGLFFSKKMFGAKEEK